MPRTLLIQMSFIPVIGIRDLEMRGWMAGGVVTRTMALALSASGADVRFITSSEARIPEGVEGVVIPETRYWPAEWTLRKLLNCGPRDMLVKTALGSGIEVLLPAVGSERVNGLPSIGWIPDFQHRYLSQLFPEDERRRLDARHGRLAEKCRLMWCSSESVAEDFRKFFPSHACKARVASFPSLFAYEPPGKSTTARLLPYRLPPKFLLVINQFWAHKNHKIVAEALGLLREAGLRVPVVMAGLPADYRDKQNAALSETLQALAKNGSWADCLVLGKVGHDELLQLLRSATTLVQPSRFEGWNTTVEDAKALGCPVILSDLEVHREQCPDALGFFDYNDAQALADIIADHWTGMPARPDPNLERKSLEAAHRRGLEFGSCIARICAEAAI